MQVLFFCSDVGEFDFCEVRFIFGVAFIMPLELLAQNIVDGRRLIIVLGTIVILEGVVVDMSILTLL